jgi:hypothetical protein
VSGAVFYWHKGVALGVRLQSQFRDPWSLRDRWSDTRITFSGPELASLRDALNRLDLPAQPPLLGLTGPRAATGQPCRPRPGGPR